MMIHIYVDADGCPVKDEVNRVARRFGLHVTLVANSWMRIPLAEGLELVVVDQGFDAADDWIVEHIQPNDIVITADIPLAARCLKKGAAALGPKGQAFTEASIGDVLATRDIMAHLRESGVNTGGPAPFSKVDRSRFLQQLDVMVHACMRQT